MAPTDPSTDHGSTARSHQVRLAEIQVGDDPDVWAAAGFTVAGDAVRVGATTLILTGAADARGIAAWSLSGLDRPPGTPAEQSTGTLDGLPTTFLDEPDEPDRRGDGPVHPNGVTGLDHVVVSTPDLERTVAALEQIGLRCRRIRETTAKGAPMRQAFFRLGATILEVISGDTATGQSADEAPARWFGLALDVEDLDRTVAVLGDGVGAPRPAVQAGRRIATVRHRALGLSVAVAVMDHHGDR